MEITVEKLAEMTGHSGAVYTVIPGRSEGHVLTGSSDNVVAEWSLDTFESQPFAIRMEHTVYSLLHLESVGQLVIGTMAGGIHVVDLEKKQEIRHLAFHNAGIFDLQYDPGRDMIVALSADGSFTVWDRRDYSLLRHVRLCSEKLRKGAFSNDFSRLAIASGDGILRIYETDNYSRIASLKGHEGPVNAVAWHPSRPLLITGGKDAHLRFWQTEREFDLVRSIPAHNFAIYGIDFSPNRRWAATASRDKTIKIWDAQSFELIQRLDRKDADGHLNSVNALTWTRYRDLLVSTGDDRSIRVWQVKETA